MSKRNDGWLEKRGVAEQVWDQAPEVARAKGLPRYGGNTLGADAPSPRVKPHKFRAVATTGPLPLGVGERRYASKKEARYAHALELRRAAGDVLYWLPQVKFPMPPKPGEKSGAYILDFMVFLADGTIEHVDTKGHRTNEYRRKKCWVEENYGIKITED